MRDTILEASVYKESLSTLKNKLIKEQDLSIIEANYIVGFYDAVRSLNLFTSNYFKNFEYDGELFDLNNIQKFVKYPETFYDIVMLVMHSKTLLENFTVSFDGLNVKLSKKSKIETPTEKEVDEDSLRGLALFEQYKVAEDANYYTFFAPNYEVGKKLRTFYAQVYPNDKDIKRMPNLFFGSWCIFSSKKGFFKSQKHQDSDIWLVTFLKNNPAEMLRKKYNVKSLYDDILIRSLLSNGQEYSKAKNQLGEVYLMKANGQLGNGPNYGYHNYLNSPGHGLVDSDLELKPTYRYSSISVKNIGKVKEPFEVHNGVLMKCATNSEVVRIPDGVTEIAAGAFFGLHKVAHVICPVSLIKICAGAFEKMHGLRILQVRNTLEVIENGAFVDPGVPYELTFKNDAYKTITARDMSINTNLFVIGVIEGHRNVYDIQEYTIKKPSKLRYAPREILTAFRYLQNKFATPQEAKKTTESLVSKSLTESFKVKRQRYEMTDAYSIEGTKLILDAEKQVAPKITSLEIPEGIESIKGSFRNYTNLKTPNFPETLIDIGDADFAGSAIVTLDLYKTSITVIPERKFANMLNLETVILPKKLYELREKAFIGSMLEKIYISANCYVADLVFKDCVFLDTIYVEDFHDFTEKTNRSVLISIQQNKIKIKEGRH